METYYDNTSRWIYDLEGNYLHTKGKGIKPHCYLIDLQMFFKLKVVHR